MMTGDARAGDEANPGFLSRVALTLAAPSRAFAAVDRAPGTWWQPLVLLAIVDLVLVNFLYERVIVPAQLEAIAQGGLEGEELERAQSFVHSGAARAMAMGAAAFGTALPALAGALVLHAATASFLGGKAGFLRTWAVMCHALLVGLPENAAKVPVMMADGSLEVSFGPALFFSRDEPRSFLFNLLKQIDVFSLWAVALVGLGIAQVHRIGLGASMTTCFVLWGLWALLAAGLGLAFGR